MELIKALGNATLLILAVVSCTIIFLEAVFVGGVLLQPLLGF